MAEKKTGRGRPKGSGIDDTPTLLAMADVIRNDPDAKRTTVIKDLGITNQSHIRRLRDKFASMEKDLLAGKVPTADKSGAAPAAKAERKSAGTKSSGAKSAAPKSKTPVRKAAAPKAAASKTKARAAAKEAPKATTKKTSKPASKAAPKSAAKPTPQMAARTMNVAAQEASKAATRATKQASKAVSAQKDVVEAASKAQSEAANAMTSSTRDTAAMATNFGTAMNGMAPFAAMPWANAGLETAVTKMVENQMSLYEAAMKNSPVAAFLRQQALMMDMALSMMKTQQQWAKSAQPTSH